MNMSTIRCCSTWNEPIVVPNCFRVFEYSSVAEFSSPIAPTASAQSAPMARSRQASSAATPSPSLPEQLAANVAQAHLGGAPTVDGLEALQMQVGGAAIDDEQADAARDLCVGPKCGRKRSDSPPKVPR